MMLVIQDWQNISKPIQQQILRRPQRLNDVQLQVQNIITAVKERGDEALFELTREFDQLELNSFVISSDEINQAQIDKVNLEAISTAIKTLTIYHQAILPSAKTINTAPGITIQRIYRPIDKVGLYIPGGNNTPLVSSLLMQAIPAHIAGCPLRILCTPPNSRGEIDASLLVAARLCHIEKIYKIGGAQAIAAMAYGTESIPKVDKLFGPGNRFVTEAKTQVSIDPCGAAIDMPAGPSEVMIIVDEKANPAFVAADLLAQAEHGSDSQVLLICENMPFAQAVNLQIQQQLTQCKRSSVIRQSLSHSTIILCPNRADQLLIINQYAPEHLIINRSDASEWVESITAAGTIFLGPWAAETMGDYVTGSNHVLPTNGFARSCSGLSTTDFFKALTVQSVDEQGIKTLGHAAEKLALLEGLDAHANAVRLRIEALEY